MKKCLCGVDLRKYHFDIIEKRYGVNYVLLKKLPATNSYRPLSTILSSEQRTAIGMGVMNKEFNVHEVAHNIDMDPSSLYNLGRQMNNLYLNRVENPTLTRTSAGGAPLLLDPQAESEYKEYLERKSSKNDCVKANMSGSTSVFHEKVKESMERQGKAPHRQIPCDRSIKSTEARLEITREKGRTISKVRVEAVECPRNAITHAVGLELVCKNKLPCLLLNMDATQYMGTVDNQKCDLLVFRKGSNPKFEARSILEEETGFFVKYVSIYAANGFALPPIFIVAREEMDQDQFIYEKVLLLSHSSDPTHYGYIIWAKSRAGNDNMFRWIFLEILFPYIDKLRESSGLQPDDDGYDEKSTAVFYLDGEAIQIKATQFPEVLNASKHHNVYFMKHCASCSLIHQLCDLSAIYRNTKADIAKLEISEYSNVSLETHINRAIERSNDNLLYTAGEKRKLVRVLLKVTHSLKKHVSIHNIQSAAKKAGMIQYLVDESWEKDTRYVPFKASTYKFSKLENEQIISKWDVLSACFLENGTISDAFMDLHDIPRADFDDGSVHKENLVEYRWRSAMLNHSVVIDTIRKRYEAKKAEEERKEYQKNRKRKHCKI
jgi:hypothetical protein